MLFVSLCSYSTITGSCSSSSNSSSNIIFLYRLLNIYTLFFEICKHIADSFFQFLVLQPLSKFPVHENTVNKESFAMEQNHMEHRRKTGISLVRGSSFLLRHAAW